MEIAEDGVVDGELAVEDLLKIRRDVAEPEVEALEGLELVGNTRREGADGDVADVTEEMLDANLLCFFGLDDRRGVDKGLGGGCAVLHTGLVAS